VLGGRIRQWGVAKTVHSTLGAWEGGFRRHRGEPLETGFVVADEQSMMSAELTASLFDAIPPDAHVLLLGDPNQLDPVDAGCPFRSLLKIEVLDHYRLTRTHRNDGALLDLVKSVGDGVWPNDFARDAMTKRGGVGFSPMPAAVPDFFTRLAHDVRDAASRHGGLSRVGVLCPKRRGSISVPDFNVTYLNHALREVLNPDAEGRLKIRGTQFRINDRIIVTRNMTLGLVDAPEDDRTYVANGDTGRLVSAQHGRNDEGEFLERVVLELDDDRKVVMPGDVIDRLGLSYAITVHAAQGSEYEEVFAFVTPGHRQFMHQSLVMTQLSRARKFLRIYGDDGVVSTVVGTPSPVRQCALIERVNQRIRCHDVPANGEEDAGVVSALPRMRAVA